MPYLRGFIFYIILAFSVILLSVVVLLTTCFTDYTWRYEKLCRPWARFILDTLRVICGIKIQVIGQENMPTNGDPMVVLAKHQSAWDPFWLGAFLAKPACFLYKKSLHWIPFIGWVIWSMQMLAIDRSQGRSAFRNFMEKGPVFLQRGWWICLFPEGTRVPPGQRVRLKTGGARFACAHGVDILPITHNAGYCWPKNSLAKYPGTIRVVIGQPITTEGKNPTEISEQLEEWFARYDKKLGSSRE